MDTRINAQSFHSPFPKRKFLLKRVVPDGVSTRLPSPTERPSIKSIGHTTPVLQKEVMKLAFKSLYQMEVLQPFIVPKVALSSIYKSFNFKSAHDKFLNWHRSFNPEARTC